MHNVKPNRLHRVLKFSEHKLAPLPPLTYNQASLVRYGKTALAVRHNTVEKCQEQDAVGRYGIRDKA